MSFSLLYFGSFNPVHLGHIAIAKKALELTGADDLFFVLSPMSPHKTDIPQASMTDRAAMLRLAIGTADHIHLSLIEAQLPQPSFTIQTLDFLRQSEPNTKFAILMGGDNLATIETWKDYQRILDEYPIYVYHREGSHYQTEVGHIHRLDLQLYSVSSSDIRQRLSRSQSVEGLLDSSVLTYIDQHGLYRL